MKLILITDVELVIPMGLRPDTYLTKGKVYQGDLTPTMYDPNTLHPVDPSYVVKCDDGKLRKFEAKHFMVIEEWREKQLDKILNRLLNER